MIIDWSICECCGQPASQRVIRTRTYCPLTKTPLTTEQLQTFYPNICDVCFNDLVANFQGDEIWLEYERRRDYFKSHYKVVGFHPIIEPINSQVTGLGTVSYIII